ncbi:sugar ABC transporter permease [Mangrovactinospora gilvigrisea]|uniref:Sugar ABC transporter permease n=1 Tax=Mangrovactinospora gilvigrisea TaxID=1428644 RepID=A0A1J7B9W2_9ACTN|nr:sugar ABC transporter permease [Mangrovactinospora gilvigrisea]OIV35471.1 sugar ABC transporter permease [Mangrovactinospora gilvigrisea]
MSTETNPTGGTKRRRRLGIRGREALWGYGLIAPTALGLGVFYVWPVIQTLYVSFNSWGPFGGLKWLGLDNYRELFKDEAVGRSLLNSALYTLMVLIGIPVALVLANLLNRRLLRGKSFYRVLYFLPVVTMPTAVAMIWRWLLNGDFGLVNYLLGKVGIHGANWLSDPNTALIAIAAVGIWASLGYNIILFVAGLQSVPDQLYEAAELDGAGPVTVFFKVTLPLVSPTVFFVAVITVINALQVFDLIYLMMSTSANPALPATRSIVYLFYQRAFMENDRSYGAAIAFLLMIIIVICTAVQFRLQKRWVHYE